MHRSASLVLPVIPRMSSLCKECGCNCNSCLNNNSLDLHHEIEDLRSQLRKSTEQLSQVQHESENSREVMQYEINKLQDELIKLRDRYDRLYEGYKKLQKVNQGLEDKLLKVVNKYEFDKTALQKEVSSITSRLVDAKATICEIEEENERFRNDCNLAVQLLQCKPSNFVAHRLNTLPVDLQDRVKCHLTRDEILDLEESQEEPEITKTIRVPMPTFPPTAMVYSVNKVSLPNDTRTMKPDPTVPSSLIAKVLSHPEPTRKPRRTYICCRCIRDVVFMDKEVQANLIQEHNGYGSFVGLRVHRPRLNSTETEIN